MSDCGFTSVVHWANVESGSQFFQTDHLAVTLITVSTPHITGRWHKAGGRFSFLFPSTLVNCNLAVAPPDIQAQLFLMHLTPI